jgi:hypothetical protein
LQCFDLFAEFISARPRASICGPSETSALLLAVMMARLLVEHLEFRRPRFRRGVEFQQVGKQSLQ